MCGALLLGLPVQVDGRRPFHAILDVGLVHATRGSRVFGALKGCVDGGVFIPHSASRFPGYEDPDPDFQPAPTRKKKGGAKQAAEKPTGQLDVETHRRYIFGQHVAWPFCWIVLSSGHSSQESLQSGDENQVS